MQVRNLDPHRNASIPREQQELTARCGFEEPSLRLGEAECGLHAGRFHSPMTPQEDDGAIAVPEALAPYMGGIKKIERS